MHLKSHYYLMQIILVICYALIITPDSRLFCQTGDIRVHDPVMIKQDSLYYLFCTGRGISIHRSSDLYHWKRVGRVFESPPEWAMQAVPGFRGHIWAPDIFYADGTYFLYYSVSSFGKNTSCIGVVTNKTLHPDDPDYHWTDHGKVIESIPFRDDWNAIDPNVIMEEDGSAWMVFGSFWSGIKLVRLTPDLLQIQKEPQEWRALARRPRSPDIPLDQAGDGAIEAPFIVRRNQHYFLFVSFDYCCRGVNSNYKIMVGRADNIRGPYLDHENVPMLEGGGSLLLGGNERWPGLGHCAVFHEAGQDWLVYHAYDAENEGRMTLRIQQLNWDEAGWPVVGEPVSAGRSD
jgi:arabinan endo-1,5-alpha-L-arabinosidase